MSREWGCRYTNELCMNQHWYYKEKGIDTPKIKLRDFENESPHMRKFMDIARQDGCMKHLCEQYKKMFLSEQPLEESEQGDN